MELSWGTTPEGEITGVDYHDGRLVGLRYLEGELLELEIFLSPKHAGVATEKTTTIQLHGVSDFNLQEICKGNDVADIYIHKLSEYKQPVYDSPLDGFNILYKSLYGDDTREVAARLIQREPDCNLFTLMSSYGGQLAAI